MDFKGTLQNKFKSRQKVCKKCERTAICQNIASGGSPRPRFRNNILTCRSLFTLFGVLLNLVWTFPLKYIALLWCRLIFQWFRWLLCLIFWTFCSDFAEVLPDKRLGPNSCMMGIWARAICPCFQDMTSGVPVGGKENYNWIFYGNFNTLLTFNWHTWFSIEILVFYWFSIEI